MVQDLKAEAVSRRYWVVGLGRVGSLIARLAVANGSLAGITVKESSDLDRARDIADGAPVTTVIPSLFPSETVLLLCVPDKLLASVATQWREVGVRSIVHFSGAFGTVELREQLRDGVAVAGLHPLLSVSTSEMEVADARDVTFGLSGQGEARNAALEIAGWLGGHVVDVDEESRAAWHLAATIASNGVYALLNIATQVAASAGITGFDVERGLASLAAQSAQSASVHGAVEGATGPVVRGDAPTIERHLRVLQHMPDARALYVELTRALVDIAEMRGTNERMLVAIRSLMESASKPD